MTPAFEFVQGESISSLIRKPSIEALQREIANDYPVAGARRQQLAQTENAIVQGNVDLDAMRRLVVDRLALRAFVVADDRLIAAIDSRISSLSLQLKQRNERLCSL